MCSHFKVVTSFGGNIMHEDKLLILVQHGSLDQKLNAINVLKPIIIENGKITLANEIHKLTSSIDGLNGFTEEEFKLMSTNYLTKNVQFGNERAHFYLFDYLKTDNMPDKEILKLKLPLFQAIEFVSAAFNTNYQFSVSNFENDVEFQGLLVLGQTIDVMKNLDDPYNVYDSKLPHELLLARGMNKVVTALDKRETIKNEFHLDEIEKFKEIKLPYVFMHYVIETAKSGRPLAIERAYAESMKGYEEKTLVDMFMPLAELQGLKRNINENKMHLQVQSKFAKQSVVYPIVNKFKDVFTMQYFLNQIESDDTKFNFNDGDFWTAVEKSSELVKPFANYVADKYLAKIENTNKQK